MAHGESDGAAGYLYQITILITSTRTKQVRQKKSTLMAKLELNRSLGINALSGKLGGRIYRTLKSGKIVVYMPPQKRTTPLSEAEREGRTLFARIAAEVARRMREGDKRPKKHIWREVKEKLTQEPDKTQVRPE